MSMPELKCFLHPDFQVLLVSACSDKLSNHQRATYLSWLDTSELVRYQRMVKQEAGDCFLACRAIVRQVIADVLGGSPQQVLLTVSPFGKPECRVDLFPPDLTIAGIHFSITHKASAIAVVFSIAPIGVDLETVTSDEKIMVARRFFTSREADYLQSLRPEARKEGFTKIWVLKEAEVKRKGSTLAEQMGKVAFDVDGENIRCHGNSGAGYYQLFHMDSKEKAGYLAIAGSAWNRKTLFSVKGLPLEGYERLPLKLVAESSQL